VPFTRTNASIVWVPVTDGATTVGRLHDQLGPQVFVGQPDSTLAGLVLFWAVFYVWIGSEMFLGWKLRPAAGAVVSDAGSRWLLVGSIWVGVALGIGLAAAVPATAFIVGRRPLFYAGLALMVGGLAFRWYAIRVLGKSFTYTVATRSDQTVVEAGPYRWIRHPSYTGALLTILGMLVCMTNPLAFLGLLPPLGGYAYRIAVEERALARSLGEPYRSYMRRTKRLIPFLV
jgi:protein-S-isoprenylcysteine O-methyltransferase Ste14